jgi:hypothetical protein
MRVLGGRRLQYVLSLEQIDQRITDSCKKIGIDGISSEMSISHVKRNSAGMVLAQSKTILIGSPSPS